MGTPMANRNQPECEGLIGFFVDTLALRGDLSGDPTFRTLMGRVRETRAWSLCPSKHSRSKLVDELHPQRDRVAIRSFRSCLRSTRARGRNWTCRG